MDGKTAKPVAHTAGGHPLLPTSDPLHRSKVLITIFVFVCRGRRGILTLCLPHTCDGYEKSFPSVYTMLHNLLLPFHFLTNYSMQQSSQKQVFFVSFTFLNLFFFKDCWMETTQTAQQLAVKDNVFWYFYTIEI